MELEFPEIFFDRHGQAKKAQAGFDVVIGNPPWIRQELLSSEDKAASKATTTSITAWPISPPTS